MRCVRGMDMTALTAPLRMLSKPPSAVLSLLTILGMMSGLMKRDDVWCTGRDDTAYACFSIAFVTSSGRAFMIPFISGPFILTFHFYVGDFKPLGSTFVITLKVPFMYIILLVFEVTSCACGIDVCYARCVFVICYMVHGTWYTHFLSSS